MRRAGRLQLDLDGKPLFLRHIPAGECSSFEERVGLSAQPGFAAGIAEKPPHPAKGAGEPWYSEIRKR
jgi:hypothetical protein